MTYHFLLHVVLIVIPPGTSGAATSMPARGSIGDDGVLKAASRSAVEKVLRHPIELSPTW